MKHVLSSHLFIKHRLTTVWLDRVWNAGIPLVEIFCARQSLDYHDRAQINELAHWFHDSELKLWSMHAPMYTDDVWGKSGPQSVVSITETSKPRRVANVDEIKRAIEIAETIPFRYLIQHLGASGEEWDDQKVDAAFTCLEDLKVFAGHRGVEILLENIPNAFSTSDRLRYFLGITHLDLNFCFDVGHAHMTEGIEPAFERMKDRIRSTHIHNNDGKKDLHLFPYFAPQGTIDWKKTMGLLRTLEDQYPLLLELREVESMDEPFARVQEIFDKLENE